MICVTLEHIDRGIQRSCGECPIALAILDHLLPLRPTSIEVSAMRVVIDLGKRISQMLPDDAAQFVCDFDDGLPVKPFSFDLQELDVLSQR